MSTIDPDAPNSCIHTFHSADHPVWAADLGRVAEVHFTEIVARDQHREYFDPLHAEMF